MKKAMLITTAATLVFSATANAWWGSPGWQGGQEPNTPYFYGYGPAAPPTGKDVQPASPEVDAADTYGRFAPRHLPQPMQQRFQYMEQQREAMRQRMQQMRPQHPGGRVDYRKQMQERRDQWLKAIEARRAAMRSPMPFQRLAPFAGGVPFATSRPDIEEMRNKMESMRQEVREQMDRMKPPALPDLDALFKAMEKRHEALHRQMQERREQSMAIHSHAPKGPGKDAEKPAAAADDAAKEAETKKPVAVEEKAAEPAPQAQPEPQAKPEEESKPAKAEAATTQSAEPIQPIKA